MLQLGKMLEIANELLKYGNDLAAIQEMRWAEQGQIDKKTILACLQWF